MRPAWVWQGGDGQYRVSIYSLVVKTYGSEDNAKAHRDQINDAIDRPKGLNQRPAKKRTT